ncbi:triose-phosphate isomerase [Hoeflea sp. WL0058]|uniref:Triosephosphate isomerase n=1 Tax=Flavimaribacter sediminis TaxID=2865987 RepID=A0AAE2ZLK5_9HYPH|nr:triose-phosphate isomerase [Flavimaribacter sediminis]MBW8636915.1 triose-phosphate isomerase [Flavimaribacter sediminis]
MTPGVKPLVAGNWKMNGDRNALHEITAIANGIDGALDEKIDAIICPPATLLYLAAGSVLDTPLSIGAQDCHQSASGAHTGDIAATMIKETGATHVIVGHSERRTDHHEDDALVRVKAIAAHEQGLVSIICIGETKDEREAGETLTILGAQLAGSLPENCTEFNTVVAYEPVWAIGTGLTPSIDDVAEAHAFIRSRLEDRFGEAGSKMRLLYGGSVKPGNASELMAVVNVDGALVGGASLKSADFLAICEAYRS